MHKPHLKKVHGRWGVCAYRLNRFGKPTHPLHWGRTIDEAWENYQEASIAYLLNGPKPYLGKKRRG